MQQCLKKNLVKYIILIDTWIWINLVIAFNEVILKDSDQLEI